MSKKTVKVCRGRLNADGYGDFVKCTECKNLMLIQIGGINCCNFKSKNLMWVDEDNPECNAIYLENMGYMVEDKL